MATEEEQSWGVWNVNLREWAFAPIPSGEARAREVAARFERESFEGKHVGPVCKYEARRVGATAPDLLSELSAADHLRSSWALAELCKRAADRIRELETQVSMRDDALVAEVRKTRDALDVLENERNSHRVTKAARDSARRDVDAWAMAHGSEREAHERSMAYAMDRERGIHAITMQQRDEARAERDAAIDDCAKALGDGERLRAELASVLAQFAAYREADKSDEKPATSRRRIADACDAMLAALDHTRPHTKEDHPGIVRAIDGLVMARIAEWASGEGLETKT